MRRSSFLAMLCACALLPAWGQFGSFFRQMQPMPQSEVSGTARLDPSAVVVGQPCGILIELDVEKTVGIDDLRVGGLPEAENGKIEYGESFENLADGASSIKNHVVKRFRLPVRFLSPVEQDVSLVVQGMLVTRRQTGGMSFSSSHNFGKRLAPFRLDVKPLPDHGRPQNFSGAVGTRYKMTQKLVPDHVHPGDLVTATYELTFDGYCPSNIWPTVERLSKEFKAYDPKEIERTPNRVKWTQILVPRTVAATNSALVAVNYYNLETKRYEVARAYPKKLTFVSAEAASTENTSVTVTDTPAPDAPAAPTSAQPIVLRFAPADSSPVIETLPPGTPVKELSRVHGWRRLESSRAIGWNRLSPKN